MHRTFALSTLVGLCLVACPAAAEDCRLQLETSLPISWDALGRATVPVTIDGSDFDLLVDTGSVAPLLNRAVARKLQLTERVVDATQNSPPLRSAAPLNNAAPGAFDPPNNYIAGRERYVAAKSVSLGRLDASDVRFRIEPSIETARMSDGRIAAQILRHYEVEFDFAGGKINLFNQHHCAGRLAYWTHDAPLEIPFRTDLDGHIVVDVQLDGQTLEAVVDSGGAETALDGDATQSLFHIDTKALGPGGGHSHYPFKTLSIGGLDVSAPSIMVMPHRVLPNTDTPLPNLRMAIGMNVLRQLRMVVSYDDKKIYATAAAPDASANQYDAFSSGFNANAQGAAPDAVNAFSAALQGNGLPPSSLAAAHQGRAFAELAADRCQEALADLDATLSASGRAPYVHFLRGRALDCLGRQPEAGEEYSALIATGTQPGAYAFRGWLLWRSGDGAAAEQDFSALMRTVHPLRITPLPTRWF